MDSDVCLEDMLRLADQEVISDGEVEELCWLVGGLNAWLRRGGVLPRNWRRDLVCFDCNQRVPPEGILCHEHRAREMRR